MPTHASTPAAADHSPTSSHSVPPLLRLKKMVLNVQFAWFIGHVATLSSGLLFLVSGRPSAYYTALLGMLLSYGIILYRSIIAMGAAIRTNWRVVAQKLVNDVNSLYFLLGVIFYLSPTPCFTLLLPHIMFSSFHVIGYMKDAAIPTLLARTPAQLPPLIKTFSQYGTSFIAKYQPQAVTFAGHCEALFIPLHLLVQSFTFRQSLLTTFFYFQFLRLRYNHSQAIKNSFAMIRAVLDARIGIFATHSNGALATVGKSYVWLRERIIAFGSANTTAPTSAPAAATQSREWIDFSSNCFFLYCMSNHDFNRQQQC